MTKLPSRLQEMKCKKSNNAYLLRIISLNDYITDICFCLKGMRVGHNICENFILDLTGIWKVTFSPLDLKKKKKKNYSELPPWQTTCWWHMWGVSCWFLQRCCGIWQWLYWVSYRLYHSRDWGREPGKLFIGWAKTIKIITLKVT